MNEDLRRLEDRIAGLELRLMRLETAGLVPAAAEAATAPPDNFGVPLLPDLGLSPTRVVFLLGRGIMILAGAFLLRYLTESGTLPPAIGFGLGLAYGLALIALAARAAGQQPVDGFTHGLAGALVAYPFLYETIVTLKLVSPMIGGLALAVVTGAGLATAWHHHQRPLAWVFTVPALLLITALGFATGLPVFFGGELIVLGAATVLLAYTRHWHLKRWAVAGMADLVVFRLGVMAAGQAAGQAPGPNTAPLPVAAVQILCLALMTVYIALFVFRALAQRRGVRVFDVCQSALVLMIGFGGALRIAPHAGIGPVVLGLTALAAALAGYAVAFTAFRQRQVRGRGFFYFASLGLVCLVLSSRAVAHGDGLSGLWLALAVTMAALGTRYDRVTLRTHSVVYLLLASGQTGLLLSALNSLTAGAGTVWHQPGPMGLTALAVAIGVASTLGRLRGTKEHGRWRKAPRLLAVVLVLPGMTWLAVLGLVGMFSSVPPATDPPILAAVRTGVLSALAIALAVASRRPLLQEMRWLVYPVLCLGLAKIVIEDLRFGNPLGLFFAFAMLGGALILAPRFLRRPQTEVVAEPALDAAGQQL